MEGFFKNSLGKTCIVILGGVYLFYQLIINNQTNDIMTTLTAKELETVKILIQLGDSEELALETVINDRPSTEKRQQQLESNLYKAYIQ